MLSLIPGTRWLSSRHEHHICLGSGPCAGARDAFQKSGVPIEGPHHNGYTNMRICIFIYTYMGVYVGIPSVMPLYDNCLEKTSILLGSRCFLGHVLDPSLNRDF